MLGPRFVEFCRLKFRSLVTSVVIGALLARIRSEVREPLADDWTALVLEYTAGARIAA